MIKLKLYFLTIISVLSVISLTSCLDLETTGRDEKFLVDSKGGTAEIIVVMDSVRWNGKLGKALRDIYEDAMPGLPQIEKRFKLIYIHPSDLENFLRLQHNLLLVTPLDDDSRTGKAMKGFYSRESLKKIQDNPDLFMLTKQDVYARGQSVLYLFGRNDEELIENMKNKSRVILEYFRIAERQRIIKRLLDDGQEQKKLEEYIKENYQLDTRIPSNFDVARNEENFIWLRKLLSDVREQDIFITHVPYTSKDQFKLENIIDLRNEIGRTFLNDTVYSTLDSAFMSTEVKFFPPTSTEINYNGLYAVETRGLWKLANATQGGAFLSYVFVDEKRKRLYYVEGYLYAPDTQTKLVFMLELESILRTFKPLK